MKDILYPILRPDPRSFEQKRLAYNLRDRSIRHLQASFDHSSPNPTSAL